MGLRKKIIIHSLSKNIYNSIILNCFLFCKLSNMAILHLTIFLNHLIKKKRLFHLEWDIHLGYILFILCYQDNSVVLNKAFNNCRRKETEEFHIMVVLGRKGGSVYSYPSHILWGHGQLSSVIQTEMTEILVAKTSQFIRVYALPEKAVPSLIIIILLCACAQVKSLTTR